MAVCEGKWQTASRRAPLSREKQRRERLEREAREVMDTKGWELEIMQGTRRVPDIRGICQWQCLKSGSQDSSPQWQTGLKIIVVGVIVCGLCGYGSAAVPGVDLSGSTELVLKDDVVHMPSSTLASLASMAAEFHFDGLWMKRVQLLSASHSVTEDLPRSENRLEGDGSEIRDHPYLLLPFHCHIPIGHHFSCSCQNRIC